MMDMPNATSTSPSRLKRGLGCLTTILGVFLAIYLIIFHSSLPMKWLAGRIVKDFQQKGQDVVIEGVGGSLASGLSIKTLVLPGEAGTTSIKGFKLRYRNISKWFRGEITIEELSTEESEFVLANDAFSRTTDEPEEVDATCETNTTNRNPNAFFELQTLRLQNTHVRTADRAIDLTFPLIRLNGLKISDDLFELAELEIVSDCVEALLVDATPEKIDGIELPYKRKVTGTIGPSIHKAVTAPIDFTVAFARLEGRTLVRFIVLDGAIDATELPPDGDTYLRCKDLSIGEYIDYTDQITPEKLTVTIRESGETAKCEGGHFSLGMTRFEIETQEVDSDDPKAALVATADVAGQKLTASLRVHEDSGWPQMEVTLQGPTDVSKPSLLALVYYQREYETLGAEEKKRIDAMAEKETE